MYNHLNRRKPVEKFDRFLAVSIPMEESKSILVELIGKTAQIRRKNYSLALTVVRQCGKVSRHYHRSTDEVYLFVSGEASMAVNNMNFQVEAGDIVCISPGDHHELRAIGPEGVEFYAFSFPAYDQDDFITEGD
jgi:mannose-6-phosphate isomerase-like protein (cupin superfamily)